MDITLVLVTLLSLTLAAVMTGLAWRLAREERRRSEARVAALAAEIAPRGEIGDLPLRDPRGTWDAGRTGAGQVAIASDMFAAARSVQPPSRFAAVIVAGAIVVGTAAALVVGLSGSHRDPARSALVESGTSPAVSTEASPLELVALTHELHADRLTVRGVVRNPMSGADVYRLTAVVFLFSHDGVFVASGRAGVDAATLGPGAEAPFAVTIQGATDVGRYRVSFRTDNRVLPHVDRRDRAMAQLK